jgi:riboflavin kinase/FMN adenylyltransferase
MRILEHFEEAGPDLAGGVWAIGNFDGVHLGHQALLKRAEKEGSGARWGVLTFDPHPARLLAPEYAPPLILNATEKREALAKMGVPNCLEQSFTRDFAALSPRDFVDRVLLQGLGVAGVVVGEDFSFGKKALGKVKDLQEWLSEGGATAHVVGPVRSEGLICSSSKIRELVLQGRVDGAGHLLGRPYFLAGRVVEGDGRGRKIGVATANLEIDRELMPKLGVYAGFARLSSGENLPAVTNIGLRPTFSGEGIRVEAHLLDCELDLYGQSLVVELHAHLRDERKFGGPEALTEQIRKDVAQTRDVLKTRIPGQITTQGPL